MKRQIIGHFLFWCMLIAFDMSGYIPVWSNKTGIGATINYGWILSVFYGAYISSLSYFNSDREYNRLASSKQFWIILLLPVIYISGSMLTDIYLLKVYYAATAWTYFVSRFIMIYPFLTSAIFLAGFQSRAIQFGKVRKERNNLLVENNYLREEQEQLLKENNLLKFEVIAKRAALDELHREYHEKFDNYEAIIQRLKNGDDAFD